MKPDRETPKAQEAYMLYLALGPERSLKKLEAQMYPDKPGSHIRRLEEWSRSFAWVKRAQEHDAKILQEAVEAAARERQAAIDEMNKRLTEGGVELQKLALQQIRELIEAKAFGSLAAVQAFKLGVDVERQARELPDKKIEVSGHDGGPIVIKTTWGTPKVEKKEE